MAERRGVRVLDRDRALARQIPEAEREPATLALVAVAETVEAGLWDTASSDFEATESDLGVLVLEGFLLREVRIAESDCGELLGKGDVLRPWSHLGLGAPVPSRVRWTVLQRATLAYLDRRFLERAAPWPGVAAALCVRAIERAQALAVALAISSITGLPRRMLALLWTLADRFGHVGPDGVHLDLPLTHQFLARLAGATRPSVSTAIKELEREGLLSRTAEHGYVLHGEPPQTLAGAVPRMGESA